MDGSEDPKDMDLNRGGWAAADKIDPIIGNDLVYRFTIYTVTEADIDAVNSAGPYVQLVQEKNVEVVGRFLRKAGVPEGLLTGDWDELRGFIRGRPNYHRYQPVLVFRTPLIVVV